MSWVSLAHGLKRSSCKCCGRVEIRNSHKISSSTRRSETVISSVFSYTSRSSWYKRWKKEEKRQGTHHPRLLWGQDLQSMMAVFKQIWKGKLAQSKSKLCVMISSNDVVSAWRAITEVSFPFGVKDSSLFGYRYHHNGRCSDEGVVGMEATRNSPLLQILRVDCGLVSNKEVIRSEAKVGLNQSPIAVVALTMLEMSVGWWRVKSLAAEICTFSSSPGRNHLHPSLVQIWPSPASAEFSYVIVFFGSIVQPMGDVCLCMSITWATFNFAGDRDQCDLKLLCPGGTFNRKKHMNLFNFPIFTSRWWYHGPREPCRYI